MAEDPDNSKHDQKRRYDAHEIVFRMARDAAFADTLLDVLLEHYQFELAVREKLSAFDELSYLNELDRRMDYEKEEQVPF